MRGVRGMQSLSGWFEAELFQGTGSAGPPVLCFAGSGGKTSLIWLLARALAGAPGSGKRRVLVTPTTKMEYPAACEGLYDVFSNGALPAGAGGVGLAGRLNQETGKLEALPDELLARGFGDFDLVLIESDGSRGLPLKGWADHEPVIPVFTSCTVGILPLWPLGKPVSEVLVHRLPLFCALTGAKEGDILRPGHLIRLIRGGLGGEGGGRGLFAAARGGKILFLNQVEDRAALEEARELAALLPRCPQGPRRIIAGSVRLDQAVEL